VAEVGADVTSFGVGDRVFGYNEGAFGAHAEYMTIAEDGALATMPAHATFAEAAAATEGSHYALSFTRRAKIASGHDVLVYGATGAIGSAAVQLAKSTGAGLPQGTARPARGGLRDPDVHAAGAPHDRRRRVLPRHRRPNQPTPVQERMPLLIGGGGERRTMKIAARYADEWNAWTTPEVLAHKVKVLHAHGHDTGRDAAEIHVSTQGLLFLSTDKSWLARYRSDEPARPMIVGTPDEVAEIVGRYRDAGADELIVPAFTFSTLERAKDTRDLFIEEVAPQFR